MSKVYREVFYLVPYIKLHDYGDRFTSGMLRYFKEHEAPTHERDYVRADLPKTEYYVLISEEEANEN
jgi:hypothetical protein